MHKSDLHAVKSCESDAQNREQIRSDTTYPIPRSSLQWRDLGKERISEIDEIEIGERLMRSRLGRDREEELTMQDVHLSASGLR